MRIIIISLFTFLFVWLGLFSPLLAQDELFNIIAAQDLDNSTQGQYDRGEWSRDWNNPLWENGLDNIYIADEQGERVMKFNYPQGTWHPFEGGAQWLAPFEPGLQEVYF